MEETVVHVDPSCPFAWITQRWLAGLEEQGVLRLDVRLLSLSVVNEHRDVDAWYRRFNDLAWAPARVMLAVVDAHGPAAGRRFYEEFGTLFHVGTDTSDDADRVALAEQALAAAGLPSGLVEVANDEGYDERLRTLARDPLGLLGLDVGVPLVEVAGAIVSGPVLTRVPRGDEAVALYDALRVLARQDGFMRVERARDGALEVAG